MVDQKGALEAAREVVKEYNEHGVRQSYKGNMKCRCVEHLNARNYQISAALIECLEPVEICSMVNAPLMGKCKCGKQLSKLHMHKHCPYCGKEIKWV